MRRTTLVAGGAALVMALSACGGGTGGGTGAGPGAGQDKEGKSSLFSDPAALVAAAKAGTAKSKSSKFSMEANIAGQSLTATGLGRYDGANSAMSMNMAIAGQQLEMIFIDKALYLKLPETLRAQSGATKPWSMITAGGQDPMSKALGGTLNKAAEQNDPSKALEQIAKAGTITKAEQTQLDGQPTSHYTIDLEVAKILDQFAEAIPGGLPPAAKDKLKNVHIPTDLWLNSDQLPVQVVTDQSNVMGAMGLPVKGESKTTIKYTDWGAPVDIKAPPADQISEAPKAGG